MNEVSMELMAEQEHKEMLALRVRLDQEELLGLE